MTDTIKTSLLAQLLGSIKMLEQAIEACPNEFWNDEQEFWYKAYHTLFYLDYYLADDPASFAPPPPFTFSEFDPAGAKPPRVYTQEELSGITDFSVLSIISLIAELKFPLCLSM